MYDLCPPQLKTSRLSLRFTCEQDLPDIYAMHSIDEVNRYLPYTTWTKYQDALDWFARLQLRRAQAEAQQYIISLDADTSYIGSCIVFGFDESDASIEIGYVLHPDHWGKGYMFEAMRVFVDSLRQQLQAKRIKASVEQPNIASLALLRKLGFHHSHTTTEANNIQLQHWVYVS
jgi:ribosomal-protein-alanine N-acetyltransferase